MKLEMKFKELRNYISQIARVSVCERSSMRYETFNSIRDVDDTYDNYYVHGFDYVKSEFTGKKEVEGCNGKFVLLTCIEIVVSKEPRD